MYIISNNISLKDLFENKLGQLQIDIEKINYNYFLEISKICKENQVSYFDDLLKDLAELFQNLNKNPSIEKVNSFG